jgi:hypothetical protein
MCSQYQVDLVLCARDEAAPRHLIAMPVVAIHYKASLSIIVNYKETQEDQSSLPRVGQINWLLTVRLRSFGSRIWKEA